jgi:ferredoxin-NADP reductase
MINRWVRRPLASLRQAYVVKEIRQETPTVNTVVLTPSRRHQRPMDYRPGQFAWIRLDSPFGPLQSNPFSLSSGTDSPGNLEFTIRKAGDFTSTIGSLTPGRKVYVDGPYGDFNADYAGGERLLLIAGGVGMAPMMSILRSHAHRGDPRQHVLVAAARTPDELMFPDELEQLIIELDLDVIPVVSQPPAHWAGVAGRIDEELIAEVLNTHNLYDAQVFICGPSQMMEDVSQALVNHSVPATNIHTEQFDMV